MPLLPLLPSGVTHAGSLGFPLRTAVRPTCDRRHARPRSSHLLCCLGQTVPGFPGTRIDWRIWNRNAKTRKQFMQRNSTPVALISRPNRQPPRKRCTRATRTRSGRRATIRTSSTYAHMQLPASWCIKSEALTLYLVSLANGGVVVHAVGKKSAIWLGGRNSRALISFLRLPSIRKHTTTPSLLGSQPLPKFPNWCELSAKNGV